MEWEWLLDNLQIGISSYCMAGPGLLTSHKQTPANALAMFPCVTHLRILYPDSLGILDVLLDSSNSAIQEERVQWYKWLAMRSLWGSLQRGGTWYRIVGSTKWVILSGLQQRWSLSEVPVLYHRRDLKNLVHGHETVPYVQAHSTQSHPEYDLAICQDPLYTPSHLSSRVTFPPVTYREVDYPVPMRTSTHNTSHPSIARSCLTFSFKSEATV